MNDFFIYLMLVAASFSSGQSHVAGSQVVHIRGIPTSKNPFYSPDRDFECLDGSLLLPFSRVNDDYCDCADGSDEPGTAACTNGSFYCRNAGHRAAYIPSSWVNDEICDCCDGSDEYASGKACVDNCHDLGREARLEAQKAAELAREGNKIRQELLARGKQIKSEIKTRLVKIRGDFEEAQLTKKEKEAIKAQAEERENAALEKYKPVEAEQPEPKEHEDNEEEQLSDSEAEDYFKMLDSDSSGSITIIEIQTRATFDKNRDGVVSEEEAIYFLNGQKEVTLDEFLDAAWANIKPFLMLEQGTFKPAPADDVEGMQDGTEEHDKEEDEYTEAEEQAVDEHEAQPEEQQVQYDEETQALVDEANSARENFKQAEKAIHDLEAEIRRLEDKIDRDYGAEEEFASLDGECFEFTDSEYVYSLCLFDKVRQKSKSGGNDIVLGYWHEWVGPEQNKYSKMKYDRGLACWNGPTRSAIITLTCGKESKLISVTEPSRCEYAMEFSTPAMCNPNIEQSNMHDEL
ncbi:glucosidase 2 subunit beta [Cephus cinctus]|uniref:Glucosidase 2 subunit beta n=1 Tax=Cephus cinctus TaxID=211228 RepID=A0AAJ7C779_CEPCN|nr:glucosidase 2 subunit beta [Cephus cinctus]